MAIYNPDDPWAYVGGAGSPLATSLQQAFKASGKSDADLAAAIQADRNASGDIFTEGTGLGTRFNAILQKGGVKPNPGALQQPGWSDADASQRTDQARARNSGGDLFTSFAPMVAAGLGAVFAPATFGLSAALGAALAGGAVSLLTTGDPMKALMTGGLAYLGGQVFSGATGAGAGTTLEAGAGGAMDMGVGTSEVAKGFLSDAAPQSGIIGSEIAGTSTDPQKFLMASTNPNPGVISDASPVTASGPYAAAPSADGGAMDMYGSAAQPGSSSTVFSGDAGGKGLIGSAMDFAKANPILTAGAMQVGGGAVMGMGKNANDRAMLDKRIGADKELQQMKLRNAIDLEEWKRRFAQSGSYFDALIPFKRSANPTLTRPGGAPVFTPGGGMIASQMNAT